MTAENIDMNPSFPKVRIRYSKKNSHGWALYNEEAQSIERLFRSTADLCRYQYFSNGVRGPIKVLAPSQITLDEFFQFWIGTKVKSLKYSSIRRYKEFYALHIQPVKGTFFLSQIFLNIFANYSLEGPRMKTMPVVTETEILTANNTKEMKPMNIQTLTTTGPISAGTYRIAHSLLRQLVRFAVRYRLMPKLVLEEMPRNPRRLSSSTRFSRKNYQYLLEDAETCVRLKDSCPMLHLYIVLTQHLHLRRSEALGLRWEDIGENEIVVRRYFRKSRGTDYPPSKCKRFPIDSMTQDAIEAHRAQVNRTGQELLWVFANKKGDRPVDDENWQKRFVAKVLTHFPQSQHLNQEGSPART